MPHQVQPANPHSVDGTTNGENLGGALQHRGTANRTKNQNVEGTQPPSRQPPVPQSGSDEIELGMLAKPKKIPLSERNPRWFQKFEKKRKEQLSRRKDSSKKPDSPRPKTGGAKKPGREPPSQQPGTSKDQPIELLSPNIVPLCRTRRPTPFSKKPIPDSDLESDYSAGPATSEFRIRTDRHIKQSDPKPPPVTGSSSGFIHTRGPIPDSETDSDGTLSPEKGQHCNPGNRTTRASIAKHKKQLATKGKSSHSEHTASSTHQNSVKERRASKLTARELHLAEASFGSLKIRSSPSGSRPYHPVQLPDHQTRERQPATSNRAKERSQRSLISVIDETDESTSSNDSFSEYTPRTRLILSGILPPPKEIGNEGAKQIPEGNVITIDDPQSESGGSSVTKVRSRLLSSKIVPTAQQVQNKRPKQNPPPQSTSTNPILDKRAGPASVPAADVEMADTAVNGHDDMGDAALEDEDMNEGNTHDGEDNTMDGEDNTMEYTIHETNPAEPIMFDSDLAIHTIGHSGSSGTTVAKTNSAGDLDLQINEITETLKDFGRDTVSDMVT